jgi:hypothetical protein
MGTAQTEVQRPKYFQSRYVRIVIIGILIAVAIIVLGVIGWSMYRGSRGKPLSVEVYPGAKSIGSTQTAQGDRTVYVTEDSVQKVLEFYSRTLPKNDSNGCKKIYTDKTPSEELGHYFGRCIVDNSLGDTIQWTSITINYQLSEKSKTSQTMIEVSRDWGH